MCSTALQLTSPAHVHQARGCTHRLCGARMVTSRCSMHRRWHAIMDDCSRRNGHAVDPI